MMCVNMYVFQDTSVTAPPCGRPLIKSILSRIFFMVINQHFYGTNLNTISLARFFRCSSNATTGLSFDNFGVLPFLSFRSLNNPSSFSANSTALLLLPTGFSGLTSRLTTWLIMALHSSRGSKPSYRFRKNRVKILPISYCNNLKYQFFHK